MSRLLMAVLTFVPELLNSAACRGGWSLPNKRASSLFAWLHRLLSADLKAGGARLACQTPYLLVCWFCTNLPSFGRLPGVHADT